MDSTLYMGSEHNSPTKQWYVPSSHLWALFYFPILHMQNTLTNPTYKNPNPNKCSLKLKKPNCLKRLAIRFLGARNVSQIPQTKSLQLWWTKTQGFLQNSKYIYLKHTIMLSSNWAMQIFFDWKFEHLF